MNAPLKSLSPAVAVKGSLAAPARKAHWVLFAVLGLGIAAFDLWSKSFMFRLLEVQMGKVLLDGAEKMRVVHQEPIAVIPDLFEWEANVNYGAFSGWFGRHTGFLTALSAVALAVVAWFLWAHLRGAGPHRLWFTAALGLLWGGTLGNLYDRAALGHVRDFIKWFVVIDGRAHVWPNFNVADSAICVGVGIILVVWLVDSRRARRERAA